MTRSIYSMTPLALPLLCAALAACGGGGAGTSTVATTTTGTTSGTTTGTTGTTTGTTTTTTTTPTVTATTLPATVTISAITAGNTLAVIAFAASASSATSAASSYTASCNAGGVAKTATGTTSPITVNGLTNGTAYTCAVTATNSVGSSAASSVVATTPLASTGVATALMAGYKQAKWSSKITVTYPTDCSMTITSDGQPNHALNAYYLEPVNIDPVYSTKVATTPNSGMALTIRPYLPATTPVSTIMTFNTCPTKAATTTATTGGNIGLIISGAALFNATEGQLNGPAALTDNVTYTGLTYKNGVSTGTTATASFIDSCNGHPSPRTTGDTYHYHGVPTCVTSQVDVTGGPSHLIGVAADGFPVYGGRDINGAVITLSQLDACNGITSATPEFPAGVYHYVLPEGVTSFQSSLMCYSGNITTKQVMAMKSSGICEAPRSQFAAAPMLPGTPSMSRRVLKQAA